MPDNIIEISKKDVKVEQTEDAVPVKKEAGEYYIINKDGLCYVGKDSGKDLIEVLAFICDPTPTPDGRQGFRVGFVSPWGPASSQSPSLVYGVIEDYRSKIFLKPVKLEDSDRISDYYWKSRAQLMSRVQSSVITIPH
jgi:hypothetical protein